jgi:hypothetical protein
MSGGKSENKIKTLSASIPRRALYGGRAACCRGDIDDQGAERKSLPREQREVLAMLRQNGGDMFQTEVADNIAGDIDYAVDILMELEKKAKIKRSWDTNKSAYLVSAPIQDGT